MPTVAAFYRFTPLDDLDRRADVVRAACAAAGVTGTTLLAAEGINGTLAGTAQGIAAAMAHLRTLPGCADLQPRTSLARTPPFGRLKVRVRPEIVTMGRAEVDARRGAGTYVEPADWNALVTAPDVAVVDVRNTYETAIGRFPGTIDPGTRGFTDFPRWWDAAAPALRGRRVAMYCTGGIRCEKATAYAAAQGAEVLHLRGGVLAYLEAVPAAESLWQGDCFVFDDRVSVGHGLVEGPHRLCHGCRRAIAPEDFDHPDTEPGVSCPACRHERGDADRARFRERQRQLALAHARGHRKVSSSRSPRP